MVWLAIASTVLGTIYFAIHYRGFRRGLWFGLLGVLALSVALGVIGWLYSQHEERQRHIAKTLIKPDQIEIGDATLSLGTLSEVKAAVTNKSPYHLSELALKVTVLECKQTQAERTIRVPVDDRWPGEVVGRCTTVGQYVAREYSLNIPSGQKRAFRGYVRFDNLPVLREKEWAWHYAVEEIVARRD